MVEISIFLIVSVAEETGLNLALTETLKTGFLAARPSHDNAPVHTSDNVKLFRKSGKVTVLLHHHTLQISRSSPCDFSFFFPNLKKVFRSAIRQPGPQYPISLL